MGSYGNQASVTEGILCQATGHWIFILLCNACLFPANVTISVPPHPFFSLFLSFLHHTQFWSQRISQQVWFLLHSFSSCLPPGTLQLVGNQGVLFLVSEGSFLLFPSQMSGGFLPTLMPMGTPSPLHSLPRATEVCIPTFLPTSHR